MQSMDRIAPARIAPPGRLWFNIAKRLEADIAERRLDVGDKLPTEQQLCEKFDTNRHTVRRALAWLQARGLVESTQGRGSFVRKPSIIYQIGRRTRFSDLLQQQAAQLTTKTLTLELRPATPAIASALGMRAGAPTIFIERIGFANDHPVSIACHWFAWDRLPGFRQQYKRSQSITQTLAACGVADYTRLRTRISARLPTAAEAQLLSLPRHVPLVVTRSWNVDGDGKPLEYGEARMAADRIEIVINSESAPIPA